VALGIITRPEGPADQEWITAGRYEIDLAGERFAAAVSLKAPYDPNSLRVKN
jgi:4-methylaminobutanoate oxidase (formaldehyde-forming)